MITSRPHPSFAQLFTPKIFTVLREGYGIAEFRADCVSGLTVAIVALPLSMAIAIASGLSPDRGLYTSIIGGFAVSTLGGCRFQIGGPAGAFIILVLNAANQYGVDGLILATFLSGLILLGLGFARLGTFIKYIPYPVTVGFTAGIALIIFASQLKELLGLTLGRPEPGPLISKLTLLASSLPSFNGFAFSIGAATIALIFGLKRFRPQWPGMLIAIILASIAGLVFSLPIETIGTKFGGIPRSLPFPQLPAFSLEKIAAVLPAAMSFALLGSIESLLSATVADSMTGGRHKSNCELVAQGVANMGSSLFGGFCVTGAIARTATNIRSGAKGPVSGMLHSVFILAFMLFAAPLAKYIPLASLAGILTVVCWNMAEKPAFALLLRTSRGDALVLLTTFLLTIFRNLVEGIAAGFALGTLLFVHRMSEQVAIDHAAPLLPDDLADGESDVYDLAMAADKDILVYRISGAFFFGAAASVGAALEQIAQHPKAYIIDFSEVPVFDSTAAATIAAFVRKARKRGAAITISGTSRSVMQMLLSHGIRPPNVRFRTNLATALEFTRAQLRAGQGTEMPEANKKAEE